MRVSTLPSPGLLTNGVQLRIEAAKAISTAEINAMRTAGGKVPMAKTLSDFFTSCATALNALHEEVVPTISSRTATSATVVTIVFSEAMDTSVLPLPGAFAVSGDTITSLTWTDSTHLVLHGTGFAAAESLVYTAPAVSYLRDAAQNKLASSTANLS